jgi:hypothetical protein
LTFYLKKFLERAISGEVIILASAYFFGIGVGVKMRSMPGTGGASKL